MREYAYSSFYRRISFLLDTLFETHYNSRANILIFHKMHILYTHYSIKYSVKNKYSMSKASKDTLTLPKA